MGLTSSRVARSQKSYKEWVINRSGAPFYTKKYENSTDFGHFFTRELYFRRFPGICKLFKGDNGACSA